MRDVVNHIFIFAVTLLLQIFVGCGSANRIHYVEVETTVHDTVTIEKTTTFIDTVLTISNSDSVSYRGTDTTSTLSIAGAISTASYSEGELTHSLYSVPFLKQVSIPRVDVTSSRLHYIEKKVPYRVEVISYKTPKWCWYLVGFDVVIALLFILFLILKLKT